MNCNAVKSLSLGGMALAASFAFGEISPENEVWIQELIENAKQSPQRAAFLTEIMSLMERYAALPQRLADPDVLTLMDTDFLPKFLSFLGHPLVPEQVPEILQALKERYPMANTGASSTKKADDLVQWVMDKTKDPKMTAADITSMIHDLEECIEALESGQPMSADNFWANRAALPSLERLQELLRFLEKHLSQLDAAARDNISVSATSEVAVKPDTRREQIVPPEALQAAKRKNRKLQVLTRESTRCWKAMHEAYVKAAQDKLEDYMASHPDNTLYSLQTQLEQWYLESTHNRSEAEKALAAMKKKLAEQRVIMDVIETRMKEYKYFINVWLSEFKRREAMIRKGDTPEDTVEAFSHDNPIENYTEQI